MGWLSTDYRDFTPDKKVIPNASVTNSSSRWSLSLWQRMAIYFGVTGLCAAIGFAADLEGLWRASWLFGFGAVLIADGLARMGPDIAARKRIE